MPFYNYSDKILPNLCKGVARSKVFFILLAYACEILGIIAEDLIYNYSEQILPNLCKGVARSKVFFNPARLRSRDSWDYCRGFLVSLTCVDPPSVARGEPFARGFRLIDAGLEENPYLAALREGEVAGSIALERRADALRKHLLRLNNYIAVALIDVLPAVADSFFF